MLSTVLMPMEEQNKVFALRLRTKPGDNVHGNLHELKF